MSSHARVAIAARVTVMVVAPVVFYSWVTHNPANCVSDYDFPLGALAIGTFVISLLPIALRLIGRHQADTRPAALRLGDSWTVPDLGLIAGMLLLLLFMGSGLGRAVAYDGCGITGPGGVVTPSL